MFALIGSVDKLISSLECLERALSMGHSIAILKNKETVKVIQFPKNVKAGHAPQMLVDGLQVFSLEQIMFHLARDRSCLQWHDGVERHNWF